MVYSGTSPSGKMSQVRAEGVTKHSVIEANRGCVQGSGKGTREGEWKGGEGKGSLISPSTLCALKDSTSHDHKIHIHHSVCQCISALQMD